MARKLKVALAAVLLSMAALCLAACGSGASAPSAADSSGAAATDAASQGHGGQAAADGEHVIGVITYDLGDNEVIMFRQYLEEYIAGVCFDDVRFVYSSSISDEDALLAFIDEVAELGGEGIMSFYNIDLPAEVARCAEHGMYHIVASGTVRDADFEAVEDNEYFLGAVGPGVRIEYYTGVDMVHHFVNQAAGNRYFVMTGGATYGNEMHLERAAGMLQSLAGSYRADLGDALELAQSPEPVTVETDRLTVTVAPGYLSNGESRQAVIDAFESGEYDYVISVIPVEPISDVLSRGDAIIGQVDCYSQDNQLMFQTGQLDYLAGKYGSMVGPSFAAMYNAITGYAADFRDEGKAFRITQGLWTSESAAQFNDMYELASNVTTPAYNYEDIYSVCKAITPTATLDDLTALAEASSFESAAERRGFEASAE